ncbi:flavodoxin domain-containing protein [Spirochaeta lutea]|uniref:flavodoxin domain-containing protein n=1 Tax=Spirochaeta lutea TaxID=1480694 RepID=UPI00068F4200|nr:flavodoxin domain-containing protein [Spirochaeta lutea]
MKGIIIYQSKFGSTRTYARWIAEETGFKAVDIKKLPKADLRSAEQVVIGSPIMAKSPALTRWILKHWDQIKDKNPILFTTSGAPADSPDLKEWYQASFPDHHRRILKYFPLGGRMVVAELDGLSRFFMKLGQMMEKDPVAKAKMMEDVDAMNRASLGPLLAQIAGSR